MCIFYSHKKLRFYLFVYIFEVQSYEKKIMLQVIHTDNLLKVCFFNIEIS